MPADRALIELTDVRKAFGGNLVLDGVSFAARPGFTGLIGPNGAGKTTCLNVISGYLQPDAGTVRIGDQEVVGLAPHAVARMGVSRTFQTPRLIPDLSVVDNVLVGGTRHHRAGHVAELLGLRTAREDEARVRERAAALLDAFGLADVGGRQAGRFPIGTQKIIEVVRALLNEPTVLLLDEPAAGLGAEDVDRLVEGLRAWTGEAGTAIVIIEHDLELISRLCPVAAVLHFGRIIQFGAPEEVLRDPVVVEAYLGAGFAAGR
ncbi:ABC transporter ATP-binding protein [Pseudonocardia broussonetiae]|uniref:ABC transporter ATP-binding protein n=1 Tax=Pseudonocardia broussonetiae TaxID=2736640 RepID=A0A6M6JR45_9PSEU|nr:ABC transporter ATP-binding protein [Pseudonocardia broussonetiae]QJY49646.1 ABC transporter ATP-binding protein [Pseudonocardia broussonetiae]